MKLLTLEQVVQIHVLVISQTGGSAGLRDLGRLESAIATQAQNVYGEGIYATKFDKAASLIRGILADHPFVDGNKRTAILVGLTFLKLNGVVTEFTTGELEDFAVRVAVEKLEVSTISSWLKQHQA